MFAPAASNSVRENRGNSKNKTALKLSVRNSTPPAAGIFLNLGCQSHFLQVRFGEPEWVKIIDAYIPLLKIQTLLSLLWALKCPF